MPSILMVLQILINVFLILQENIDEVFFLIRENESGVQMLKGIFGLSLLLLTGMLGYRFTQTDDIANIEDQIQFKHLITCVLACLHALSMLLHGQSKLRDAESIYMRYLYERHKKDLPQVDPNNVSSGEGEESDNEEREVKFF